MAQPDNRRDEGRGRRAIGCAVLLAYMLAYVVAAVSLGGLVEGAPWWGQLLYYAVAGSVWIVPLKPLFVWMGGSPRQP
jgi:hypothetical protein